MMRRLDEARSAVTAVEDRDEKAFLDVALKTAWIDMRAGTRGDDFDYLTFVEVMRAIYKKKALLKDVLDGQADKHRWWPDDE
jgi:hypothetical protein